MNPEDADALLRFFTEREWGDGLPVVAPTDKRVAAMLAGADAARSLGAMPPLWRQATLEKLAVNAVMAGCEPAYFPLIVAGGPGKHSAVIPNCAFSRAVSRPITARA